MIAMVTYYWDGGTVYTARGSVVEARISWETAQEKTRQAGAAGRVLFGVDSVRIVKAPPPKGGE